MSSEDQPKGQPPAPIGQILLTVLPIALGIAVGRLAGDAVREQVGWWGSLGVSTLAAIVAALVVFFVIQAVRRRG
jgi:uncharacterized membrane protein